MSEKETSEFFSEKLRKILKDNNMSNKELAEKLNIRPSTISMWLTKNNSPRMEMIEKLADYFNVSPAYLMGWETNSQTQKHKKGVVINVLGRVAAGIPIEAVTDIINTEEITEEMAKTGEFFGLQIKGDSMEPRIKEGDVVIVRQQSDAENGEIVIATVNGDEATCKRLRKYRDGIELISNNPHYEPMFFSNEDIEKKPVKIIGRVVELRAKF